MLFTNLFQQIIVTGWELINDIGLANFKAELGLLTVPVTCRIQVEG
jgi:hypothetical protein